MSVSAPVPSVAPWLRRLDLQALAEAIPHIFWVSSPDGSVEYVNWRASDYTGRAPEALCREGWVSSVHPDDADAALRTWRQATLAGTGFEFECRLLRADGGYRWHGVSALPMYDSHGSPDGWIGTATDIHAEKASEDDLRGAERSARESDSLLEMLLDKAPVGMGFMDRDFRIVRINERLAAINGSSVREQLGREVSAVLPDIWPQLEPIYHRVLDTSQAVVDIEMSGETPADPGRQHHWLTSFYPVCVDGNVIGIGVVVVDITDRKEAIDAVANVSRSAVEAMAAAVDARDPYTAGHQRRVADISRAIAAEMGVDPFDVEGIGLAANIHDIGKIRVPAEILARPGDLHPAELELVKTHSQAGYDIVHAIAFPWPVADMIHQHHERFDGSGYPDHLAGVDIVLGARIIAVADVLEAMSSHRPYRPALGAEIALQEIRKNRGTRFDPEVVDALTRALANGRVSTAGLSNGNGRNDAPAR